MPTATRFPLHTPDTATGRAAERLGELWARHAGQVSDMVRTMAGSAALLSGYLDLSRAIKRSGLSRRVAEQISIAVQARLGCALCLDAHITAGTAAGLDADDVELAISGTATDPAVAALVAYALAVHDDPASVDETTLTALRAHGHSDRDLLDVIGLVTLNHLTGAVNLVAGLEPEEPMNTPTRLAAYGGLLVASVAGAAGIGLAVGPIDTETTGHAATTDHGATHDTGYADQPSDHPAARAGTTLDAGGFRIVAGTATVAAGAPADYSFRLVDATGTAVTRFATRHERDMHLVVASRDLTTYHHLHPDHDGRGTWTVVLPALDPGSYRVFADSQPGAAEPITLGVDLEAATGEHPVGPPPVATVADVAGLTVTMSGQPAVGGAALSFAVERDGSPVATEPYLGAAGHLVVLRAGDLAYVHAHANSGPAITFDVDFPTAGTYRLFLDFSVEGTVHTAGFTVVVADTATATGTTTPHGAH